MRVYVYACRHVREECMRAYRIVRNLFSRTLVQKNIQNLNTRNGSGKHGADIVDCLYST